ncbi:MAG: Yip1 family protein [Gemmatimonadota bacterium]
MDSQPRSLTQRMTGAALLDVDTFEEVEADETATGQAALVVVVVAACQAIGHWGSRSGMITGALAALAGWAVWAGVTYLIGTRLFDGRATWGEVLRTLGFAQAPGVLAILGLLPLVRWGVGIVLPFWMLAAGIVGLRQALDISTGKTVITAVLGWLAIAIPRIVLGW